MGIKKGQAKRPSGMEEKCIESQGLEHTIGLEKKEKEGEEYKQVTTTI